VCGECSDAGEAERNEVEIEGGNIGESAFGGESRGNGKATNNKVVITDGVIARDVNGGYSSNGKVRGNEVEIKEEELERMCGESGVILEKRKEMK
jgi:hypothetical protein